MIKTHVDASCENLYMSNKTYNEIDWVTSFLDSFPNGSQLPSARRLGFAMTTTELEFALKDFHKKKS